MLLTSSAAQRDNSIIARQTEMSNNANLKSKSVKYALAQTADDV